MDIGYDVFVSFSKQDSGWVDTFLVPGLEAAGFSVCIPARDFAVGVPEIMNTEAAIRTSKKTLLVLTRNWVAGEWSLFEGLLTQSEDPAGMRRRTLPLLLEDCVVPARLKALTPADFRDSTQWTRQLKRIIRAVHESEVAGSLAEHIEEAIKLFLVTNFDRDQYARLDQAGESDDRTTSLRKVFIDLHVKLRSGTQPQDRTRQVLLLEHYAPQSNDKPISAMRWLLQDKRYKSVVIGGPGQGKSTLGQYLAQAHRASLLGRQQDMEWHVPGLSSTSTRKHEYLPTLSRIPFRIILKYFAQWISDRREGGTVEQYLVDQFYADTSRRIAVNEVHSILKSRPVLFIFDGLDEVIEIDLRSRLLAQIQEFIQRAEQLRANMQILATSRPTGYSDHFSPELFWHLELQATSPEKVRDYAVRWVLAKVAVEEERRRILDTLTECQSEEHTKLLLTTPLQVSIVLVIIKDGGRPPAQREALFHEYWSTIFRRERAKGKGIIRSEESLLFGLHAFLGYLLHRKALRENVRSLLSKADFERLVYDYLRNNDRRSKVSLIKSKAAQIVSEARDRLVLLVEPEPGLFGFELRSLQEFFAAAYLNQSATDTVVRFRRLRAIALSEHWRNVVLFFAGRVVRNFSGEAANILELVCRPIDRDVPDRFLRRGAWLSLDIAVEGAFSSNRDLQYGAIEHALSILDSFWRLRLSRLQGSLARLSSEDRREIVRPILEQRITSTRHDSSVLLDLLEVYGSFFASRKFFVQGLEELFGRGREEKLNAFRLCAKFRADSGWLGGKIKGNWELFLESDFTVWNALSGHPKYMQDALAIVSPNTEQCVQLANALSKEVWRRAGVGEVLTLEVRTGSLPEQLSTFVACIELIRSLSRWLDSGGEFHLLGMRLRPLNAPEVLGKIKGISKFELLGKISESGIFPSLRLALWSVYWVIERPRGETVRKFFGELRVALDLGVGKEVLRQLRFGLRWPLLGLAVTACCDGEQEEFRRLSRALEVDTEAYLGRAVQENLVALAKTLEAQDWVELVAEIRGGAIRSIEGLDTIAGSLGITAQRLVRMYIAHYAPVDVSPDLALRMLAHVETILLSGGNVGSIVALLGDEVFAHPRVQNAAKELLRRICQSDQQEVKDLSSMVMLLARLAARPGKVTRSLVQSVARLVGMNEGLVWMPMRIGYPYAEKLGEALRSRDPLVKKGVIRIWTGAHASRDDFQLDPIFSWSSVRSCLGDPNIDRIGALSLLKRCSIDLNERAVKDDLLKFLESASQEEVRAWGEFLISVPVERVAVAPWIDLTERVLSEPQKFAEALMPYALECYDRLIAHSGRLESGNESELGLPTG